MIKFPWFIMFLYYFLFVWQTWPKALQHGQRQQFDNSCTAFRQGDAQTHDQTHKHAANVFSCVVCVCVANSASSLIRYTETVSRSLICSRVRSERWRRVSDSRSHRWRETRLLHLSSIWCLTVVVKSFPWWKIISADRSLKRGKKVFSKADNVRQITASIFAIWRLWWGLPDRVSTTQIGPRIRIRVR